MLSNFSSSRLIDLIFKQTTIHWVEYWTLSWRMNNFFSFILKDRNIQVTNWIDLRTYIYIFFFGFQSNNKELQNKNVLTMYIWHNIQFDTFHNFRLKNPWINLTLSHKHCQREENTILIKKGIFKNNPPDLSETSIYSHCNKYIFMIDISGLKWSGIE